MGEVGEVPGDVLRDAKLVAREKIVGTVAAEPVELLLAVVE